MASIPVSLDDNVEKPLEGDGSTPCIRVIVADTQAIFRAGLRKIFALEDDIRVVGQAESLSQTVSAIKKFSADILIFEAALASNPVDAVGELLKQGNILQAGRRSAGTAEELTLELFSPRRARYRIAGSRA
jgi:DNA-binding NarL/FixJ family response regulator